MCYSRKWTIFPLVLFPITPIVCMETLDVQPSVPPDLGIQPCNFFFFNHKGEVSAAKIIAILTQVLLPSRFPGPRSVIHAIEIEHSHPDTLRVTGGPWLWCQPCEAMGSCGTIKIFLEAAGRLFPSSTLVGTAGRASLGLWACADCGPGEALLPGTRNAGTRARCSFPVLLPVEPTASTLLLFGVWQNQRQKERTFVCATAAWRARCCTQLSLPSPGYWAWCCKLCPDKMLSQRWEFLLCSYIHSVNVHRQRNHGE